MSATSSDEDFASLFDDRDVRTVLEGTFQLRVYTCIKPRGRPRNTYWVYCEKNQENCVHTSLVDGVTGHVPCIKRMHGKEPCEELFIVEPSIGNPFGYVRGTRLRLGDRPYTVGGIEDVLECDLLDTASHDWKVTMTLVSDTEFPVHKEQNTDVASCVSQEVGKVNTTRLYTHPYEQIHRIQFMNRAKGWFRIKADLTYKGFYICTGVTDSFMFNNPRINKKRLKDYKPWEVKLMHVYVSHLNNQNAGEEQPDILEYIDHAVLMGAQVAHAMLLLDNALELVSHTKKNRRAQMHTPVVNARTAKKRTATHHPLEGEPAHKLHTSAPLASCRRGNFL